MYPEDEKISEVEEKLSQVQDVIEKFVASIQEGAAA